MPLTTCEFEIAERIALGASKKEVAWKTNRSIYTVETTVKNVYEKLGVNKLSDLVLWYCGEVFHITDEINERKKKVLTTIIILIISLNGYQNALYRVVRYRRSSEIEYNMTTNYTTEL